MEPHPFAHVLRRHALHLILATLLGTLIAAGWWWGRPATYRSTATVYFTANQGATGTELHQISVFAKESAPTYAMLATTPQVLDRAITDLGLSIASEDFARAVDTSVPVDSSLVDVSVAAPTPEAAQKRTEAVAKALIATVATLPPRNREGNSALTGTLYRPATTAQGPSSLKGLLLSGCGGFLALAAVAAGLYGRHLLRPVVASATELHRLFGVPLWASGATATSGLPEAATPVATWAERHPHATLLWCGVHPSDAAAASVLDIARWLERHGDAPTVVQVGLASDDTSAAPSTPPVHSLPQDVTAAEVRRHLQDSPTGLTLIVGEALTPGSRTAEIVRAATGVVIATTPGRCTRAQAQRAADLVRTAGGEVVAVVALPAAPLSWSLFRRPPRRGPAQ